jgi:hypothetical protein
MNQRNRDDAKEKARRALKWLESQSGKDALKESERRVAETAERLEKGREIDPAKLDEPFTV